MWRYQETHVAILTIVLTQMWATQLNIYKQLNYFYGNAKY